MQTINIRGITGDSVVIVGESISNISSYIKESQVFVITDSNVANYHRSKFPQSSVYIVDPGEKSKNLEEVANIYRWLLQNGADRNSFVLGIGGGVVCDIAGFVASTYMRGIEFGFVATSLLAQVDASVGGKNGVDFDGYKNIVGTFNQPRFVICDIDLLKTLPVDEYVNGFTEIVKHTLIADEPMFRFIEEHVEVLKEFNRDVLEKLVTHSVCLKASIVQEDEHESGVRRKLNLGHTWGHAVEKVTGLPHGKSVSIGLEFAARFSVAKNYLSNREYMRIMNLLRELDLPICLKVSPSRIYDALLKDKKKDESTMHFVFLDGIGSVKVEKVPLEEIKVFCGA